MNEVASFTSYRQAEFQLVSDLERLATLASRLDRPDLLEDIESLRHRIENHHFSIAVVGEFKRGKSTFINALLGKEILPSDIVPTSATINRVTYALKPMAKINFRDSAEEQVIGIDQLADYVTKLTPEAESMAATVEEAIVGYPVPFCKNNVDIIDTPGLSDDQAMTDVTLKILPKVDAAILVVLATAPFSQSEAAFLERLLIEYGLSSVIFVVTALDRLRTAEDQQRVLDQVAARIRERIHQHATDHYGKDSKEGEQYLRRVGDPRVFGLSGYDALMARIEHNEELLQESCFLEFESFLERFLTEESGLVALRTHTERLSQLCQEMQRRLPAALERGDRKRPPRTEVLEGLIDALEWLIREGERRLDEARRKAREQMEARLERLPQEVWPDVNQFIADLKMQAENLQPNVLTTFLVDQHTRLVRVLDNITVRAAQQQLDFLRTSFWAEMRSVLDIVVAFERVTSHADELLLAHAEAETAQTEPLTTRLGDIGGFDREKAVEAAVRETFDASSEEALGAIWEFLRLPPTWVDNVDVKAVRSAGPKFAQKAIDLVRVEKLKADLKAAWTSGIQQVMSTSRARQSQGLERQIRATFAKLESFLDEIAEGVRRCRSRLQVDLQKRSVAAEQEQHRLDAARAEVEAIQERATDLAKRLS